MTVTKEDKTTLQQKRTRNRKRSNNIKETCRGDAASSSSRGRGRGRGRRKGGENLKKKEEKMASDTITKPVIGSSNPFFIAVCAPETYKHHSSSSLAGTATGSGSSGSPTTFTGHQRVKPNVFLRSRPRSNSSGSGLGSGSGSGSYPNHFIHHPALQHSRQVEATTTMGSNASSHIDTRAGADTIISSSDLVHFPSLGGAKTVDAAGTTAKLNFKEMMIRSSTNTNTNTGTNTSTGTSTSTNTNTTIPVVMYSKQSTIIPQKSLSSSNIFLAAFHNHDGDGDGDEHDYDGDCDHDNNAHACGSGTAPVFASSVLIDSCDKKYDRLYK